MRRLRHGSDGFGTFAEGLADGGDQIERAGHQFERGIGETERR